MSDQPNDDEMKVQREPEKEREIRREARRLRALERLGTKNPTMRQLP